MRRRKEAEGAEVLELQDERGWWLFVSRCVPPVTASLGAALALVERVLPRAHKAVGTVPPGGWQDAAPGDWYASVGVDWTLRRYGAAKTAAIALILALLRALEADDEA